MAEVKKLYKYHPVFVGMYSFVGDISKSFFSVDMLHPEFISQKVNYSV